MSSKIVKEGLTFDDVLLIPQASSVLPHEVDLRQINFKEQILIGTRVYTKEEFHQAVDYCAAIQDELEKVVSHVVPMKDAPKVFDMIADPDCGTIKVVVDCTDI